MTADEDFRISLAEGAIFSKVIASVSAAIFMSEMDLPVSNLSVGTTQNSH